MTGKEYVCVMRLHSSFSEEKIKEVMNEFVGEIYQRPPLRSSVKRQVRKRKIYYIKDLETQGQYVLFRVGCQAGTYIRKLCFDVGEVLGSGAHMVELRRTRTGPFQEDENLATLYDLSYAYALFEEKDESYIRKIVQPVENALSLTPKIFVRDSAVDALCHGADLALPGVLRLHSGIKPRNVVGIFTQKEELVALASSLMSSEEMTTKDHGMAANVERVVMAPGTYPSMWRSGRKQA